MYTLMYQTNIIMISMGALVNVFLFMLLRTVICSAANKLMKGDAYLPAFRVMANLIGMTICSIAYYVINFTAFEVSTAVLVLMIGLTALKFSGYVIASLEKGGDLRKIIKRRYM